MKYLLSRNSYVCPIRIFIFHTDQSKLTVHIYSSTIHIQNQDDAQVRNVATNIINSMISNIMQPSTYIQWGRGGGQLSFPRQDTTCHCSRLNRGGEDGILCLFMQVSMVHCKENPIYVLKKLRHQPQFPHSCFSERFIYSHDRFTYFPAAEQADRSWEYIDRSQKHECRNWD